MEKRKDENGRTRTKQVPILLYFSFDGKRLQLNTGERINFSDWDFRAQRVLAPARGSQAMNRYLQSLADEVMGIYLEARTIGLNPGIDYLRKQIKYNRRKENIGFFDVYMLFIDENHHRWSIHTFRKIRTTYNHLRKFAETEQIEIELSRIDRNFLEQYIRFFRIKYSHSNNTISKNLDVLKWFLNWATTRGYNKSLLYREFQLEWIRKPRLNQSDLVLDWEELTRIWQFEPLSPQLTEVRDIFCFMCFSGLKLSRIYQLKSSNVYPDYINLQGNGKFQSYNLPLNERAYGIISRYIDKEGPDGNCFPYYRHPDFNRYLKQLGRQAGINRFVTLEIYSGQEKGTRQVPKYEILSSKMAVNTFLFNALRLGVTAEVLSFVTNSKTLYSVERIRPLLEHTAYEDIQKFNILP
ncbi:MAG: site-specific integrase, partial [Bacteroidales bacterium]|nr:site-specific integrase [Bacteroidales bacterium]